MTNVATSSSNITALAERPKASAAALKKPEKRPVNFENLKPQKSSYEKKDEGQVARFFAALRKSDTLKMFLQLTPIASIFFFIDTVTKQTNKLRNFLIGLAVAAAGPLINKFVFPFLDKYVNPHVESKVNLDEDIIWDDESKAEFNRALRQFFNYRSSVQTNDVIKPVGTRKEGMLVLAGPPGTGKSAMAEGIASQAKKKLIKIKVSDIEDKYLGESEKNMERVFSRAAKQDAILFFDEADALLRTRASSGSGSIFAAKLTNTFLQTFNEYQGRVPVILATNTPDVIDPAIKSRGFLANIKAPNLEQRMKILIKKLEANNVSKESIEKLLKEDLKGIEKLMKKHKGFTGRDIDASLVEALHISDDRIKDAKYTGSLKEGEERLLIKDLEKAFDKFKSSKKDADKSSLESNDPMQKLMNKVFKNN